jgi:hypothetical protein
VLSLVVPGKAGQMAADLDGQDWLDMDNIGQVGSAENSLLNAGL